MKHTLHASRLAKRFAHSWTNDSPRTAARRAAGKVGRVIRRTRSVDEVDVVHQILVSHSSSGTFVDVGAHHGTTLAPFLDSGWSVIAFEPNPSNRAELEAAFGSSPRLQLSSRAVSEVDDEEVTFYTSDVSDGISGLSAFDPSHKPTHRVKTTRLDTHLRSLGVDHIDALKVDVEGFDLFVIRSLDWDSYHPDVVVMEFEDAKTKPLGYKWQDSAGYLVERGYTVVVSEWVPVVAYGAEHQWRSARIFPCELECDRGWGNLVAWRDVAQVNEFVEQLSGTR